MPIFFYNLMAMSTHLEKISYEKNMSEELSGVTVVIIIGLGVLLFILLFIFAKRQIMRFALRSRRGPHIPIGHDSKKLLKRELDRRIDMIPHILCEPKLLTKVDSRYIVYPGQQIPVHFYRLKAVDDVKILESEITRQDACLVRHPNENLRAYLLTTLAAPLNGSNQKLIHQFCDLYEHARHDPNHFGDEEYQSYSRLLFKLVDAAKLLKTCNNSRRSSPNRNINKYVHQEKCHNLLDASRLNILPSSYIPCADEVLTVSDRTEANTILVSDPSVDNETSV